MESFSTFNVAQHGRLRSPVRAISLRRKVSSKDGEKDGGEWGIRGWNTPEAMVESQKIE